MTEVVGKCETSSNKVEANPARHCDTVSLILAMRTEDLFVCFQTLRKLNSIEFNK